MAKILLVEDDKALREIYGVRLLAEGYDIVSASDGEEAIVMAKKEQPDLILSDVMMPRVSGFDMLDILRNTPETQNIKVIIMTALSSDEQRAKGESLGANLYLVKSQVGIEDVVRSVKEVLENKLPSVEENNLFSGPEVSDAWSNRATSDTDQTSGDQETSVAQEETPTDETTAQPKVETLDDNTDQPVITPDQDQPNTTSVPEESSVEEQAPVNQPAETTPQIDPLPEITVPADIFEENTTTSEAESTPAPEPEIVDRNLSERSLPSYDRDEVHYPSQRTGINITPPERTPSDTDTNLSEN